VGYWKRIDFTDPTILPKDTSVPVFSRFSGFKQGTDDLLSFVFALPKTDAIAADGGGGAGAGGASVVAADSIVAAAGAAAGALAVEKVSYEFIASCLNIPLQCIILFYSIALQMN
jgi:hypothetical protein